MSDRRSTKARKSSRKLRPLNRANYKIAKWNKASDIPLDEEDLFHASRDKVLLEIDNRWQQDDNDNDVEVFALEGVDDDEENEDEDMNYEDEIKADDFEKRIRGTKKDKKKKTKEDPSKGDSESEQEESWGKSKTIWYSSNAAQLESDDEEGNELEEQEAKRLQNKMREEMEDGDFGLDDVVHIEIVNDNDVLAEPMPAVTQQLPQDRKLLIRHLEKTSPETLALARDWGDAVETLARTQEKIKTTEAETPDSISLGMLHIYYQASLTYTTILAFYLHLASSEKYSRHPELLKAHPILCRLLTLKQSLVTLEDLDFTASDSENESEDEIGDRDSSMTYENIMVDGNALWNNDELELLLKDQNEAELRAPERLEPPNKKRKTVNAATKPVNASPIFDLVEPKFVSSKAPSKHNLYDSAVIDAYGETTSLQRTDAADKSARKKSLRYHTSKIESASARRKGARSQALGGDDDIPYRVRKKESLANVKNRGQGGEDLDENEPESRKRMKDKDGGDEGAEDANAYYELVKKQVNSKKGQRKAEYEAMVEAARPDFDEDTSSGPRSLTRAILANKGLTPHRPKSVRNPRVKKRLKFEKANKRISSQKAVYKGGISESGRYDGEKSGISKVIKSIRLG